MAGISSGVGLISGINTAELIDQLIALERRPIDTLRTRAGAIDVQRAAFLGLSAQLLAVQNSVQAFGQASFFRQFNAVSSDDNVLSATASERAAPGAFSFRVRNLVATHSVLSRGFADADRSPVGAGTLTVEVGGGRVDGGTELNTLNAGAGVSRGVISITDRSGVTADIDLTAALTVSDVLNAINTNPLLNVRASVTSENSNGRSGDRIVIEDRTAAALATGNLIVADKNGGSAAASLGIAASTPDGRIDGTDLIRLSLATPLSLLNDGNGIGRVRAGDDIKFTTSDGDFSVSLGGTLALQLDTDLRVLNGGNGVRLGVVRLTDRSGASAEVDLASARTVQDVLDAINNAGVGVRASVVNSTFRIDDLTETPDLPEGVEGTKPTLKVEDVSGFAAADLGLANTSTTESIEGREVHRMSTVGDLLNAINFAPGNVSLVDAFISADGDGITLRTLGLDTTVTVSAIDGSSAAADLGMLDATLSSDTPFHTRRLVAGLNTVLLSSVRGGRGVTAGTMRLTDGAGQTADIDFSGVETLQDVIDRINADGTTALVASINGAGHGVLLRDESVGATSPPIIEDVTGTLAADLGLARAADGEPPRNAGVVDGGNVQLQYLSTQSLLADLNAGRGIGEGDFQITDTKGQTFTITVDSGLKTLGDVIDAINTATPDHIEAKINDTGDGIVVIDTGGGDNEFAISDRDGGRVAAELRLAGTAGEGENSIDGSFEVRVDVNALDTLEDVARKINEAGGEFSAAVVNHGGTLSPFSLTITSGVSGRRGEMLIDAPGLDLGLSTLSRARDAVVTLGEADAGDALLISNSSNTLTGVVPGVTLNLLSTSDEVVSVTIDRSVDSMVSAIQSFADNYNQVLSTIGSATQFNQETNERGPLLGDPTVSLIRTRLNRVMLRRFDGGDPSLSRLFSVGLRLGEGARVTFDEQRFRDAFEEDPKGVEDLFTRADTGFSAVMKQALEDLTNDFDGVISRKDDTLESQTDLINGRIDALTILLAGKRRRLESQFVGLETSLALLQGQQSALASLSF